MENIYRVKYKKGDLEIEVESSEKEYVDQKLEKLMSKHLVVPQSQKEKTKKNIVEKKIALKNDNDPPETVDIAKLISAINESDDHNKIEEHILNKSARLPKVLLCLYFAQDVLDTPITTGNIQTITDQLGIKLSSAHAGTTIKLNQKYFATDTVRKKGAIMKYKLNRKGIQAFEDLIKGGEI